MNFLSRKVIVVKEWFGYLLSTQLAQYCLKKAVLLGLWLLCISASFIAAIWMLCAILADSPRAWKLALAHDQLGNAMTGGDEDETISSRAAKAQKKRRWACVLCRLLDKFDKNHCAKSIEVDEGSPL